MKISKYYNYFKPLLEFLNIKIKLSKLTFPFLARLIIERSQIIKNAY